MQGNVIDERDKKCPECGKKYVRIVSRQKDSAVLECPNGHGWTVYFTWS